jgi:hypothetical protein
MASPLLTLAGVLLAQGAALALLAYAPIFWIRKDASAFAADPARDVFHRRFHRQRLTWRLAATAAIALLGSLPSLRAGWGPYLLASAGLASVGLAYFFYAFNPGLNQARQLPYVDRYYVSADPRAAWFPDRWLWQRACRTYPGASSAELRRLYAGHLLRQLCRWVLLAGVIVYAGCLAAGWYWSQR